MVVETAKFLGQRYRYRLIKNGNSLLVSLPLDAEHTLPTTMTHAHLLDNLHHPGNISRIKLILAFYPSIVLAFESKVHKIQAARQIRSMKFQFEDNDSIKLEVEDLRNNAASIKALYTLGSDVLYFCNYQQSLQQFFCREGFVSINDIIQTRMNGIREAEVSIRHRFCPEFLEKLTAFPGGHRDLRIPAQPAKACSLCLRAAGQDGLQSSPKDTHLPSKEPTSFPNGNGGTISGTSTLPVLKLPGPDFVAAHASLEDVKITGYIKAFTRLNGVEVTKNVPPRLFTRAFNRFLDNFYQDSDFEARLAVLHRVSLLFPAPKVRTDRLQQIDGGDRVRDWERLCAELRRHFAIVYFSKGEAVNSKRKVSSSGFLLW